MMAINDEALFPPPVSPGNLQSLWQNQVRADLKWIIDSPPLFEGPDGLKELSSENTEIHNLIASLDSKLATPPSRRVGLYYESLLDTWLAQGLNLVMDARHLQVFENGRTVGEIDFSVRDHRGTRWRLESTIKFYLHHPTSNSLHGSSFIGPDPRDSFERKYHHLMERQLQLAVPGLEPANHALPISRGILFYHLEDQHNPQHPSKANPKHLRGLWMKASEWSLVNAESLGIDRVVHLPKPFWLSGFFNPGLTSHELTLSEAGKAIKSHFYQSKAPLMLSLLQSEKEIEGEKWRCILVPDNWPIFNFYPNNDSKRKAL